MSNTWEKAIWGVEGPDDEPESDDLLEQALKNIEEVKKKKEQKMQAAREQFWKEMEKAQAERQRQQEELTEKKGKVGTTNLIRNTF